MDSKEAILKANAITNKLGKAFQTALVEINQLENETKNALQSKSDYNSTAAINGVTKRKRELNETYRMFMANTAGF